MLKPVSLGVTEKGMYYLKRGDYKLLCVGEYKGAGCGSWCPMFELKQQFFTAGLTMGGDKLVGNNIVTLYCGGSIRRFTDVKIEEDG